MYKSVIRPFFFLFTPENAHKLVSFFLKIPGIRPFIRLFYQFKNEKLRTDFAGLEFSNPVGLAAGFDKDARLIKEMENIGFGFVEIGTVTPLGQPGNPKPRIFRLPKNDALINRMGFNNLGVDAAIEKLKKIKTKGLIIGGNIGKNKVTPLGQAVEDYKICFTKLHHYADYFVVNVSSPNTPNLRQLQEKKPLIEILDSLMRINDQKDLPKPLFLKIAPDLTTGQLDDIIDIVKETGIDGIVATNTTIERDPLDYDKDYINQLGDGGLSGKPLKEKSTEIIKYIAKKSSGSIRIIAAGGIHSAEDAIEKLEAGASLVQIYTGFIFEGPGLVKRINKGILEYRKTKGRRDVG